MKLIIAIVNHDDAGAVTQNLAKNGFSSTRHRACGGVRAARGGPGGAGTAAQGPVGPALPSASSSRANSASEEKVQQVIDLIHRYSHSRRQMVPALTEMSYVPLLRAPPGDEVGVGQGAGQLHHSRSNRSTSTTNRVAPPTVTSD